MPTSDYLMIPILNILSYGLIVSVIILFVTIDLVLLVM